MNIFWNAEEYTNNFDFVYKYGEDVINLIDAKKGSFIIDLGCGNGTLTKKLNNMGYNVLGIDSSFDMLKIAQKNYPDLNFEISNALDFKLSEKADVIFSNAVIHWIDSDKQETLINNISKNIKKNGYFICEFGGKGCAESIHSSLEKNFNKRGLNYPRTFYFPTIGEYSPILEKYGFKVEYAVLFDRLTEQKTENGLKNWIDMFVKKPFENIEGNIKYEIIKETENELKNKLFKNNKWFIDYVRIRFKAKKM